mgnify:CR=1 FL=1
MLDFFLILCLGFGGLRIEAWFKICYKQILNHVAFFCNTFFQISLHEFLDFVNTFFQFLLHEFLLFVKENFTVFLLEFHCGFDTINILVMRPMKSGKLKRTTQATR